jgi:hypothetical protein
MDEMYAPLITYAVYPYMHVTLPSHILLGSLSCFSLLLLHLCDDEAELVGIDILLA